MRAIWNILDVLLFVLALVVLAAFVQGFVLGGWLRRIQYTSLADNAWRERIFTATWQSDGLEFQFDRTDYLILEDCQCGAMGRSRWDLYLANGRLRGPHARDAWRHVVVGAAATTPDASQHFATFWAPHWLPMVILALPIAARRRRRSIAK